MLRMKWIKKYMAYRQRKRDKRAMKQLSKKAGNIAKIYNAVKSGKAAML